MNDGWDFLEVESDADHQEIAVEALMVSVQLALQRVMQQQGLNQKQLAERTGYTPARISQILSNPGGNLTIKVIAKIALALGEDFEFVPRKQLRSMKKATKRHARTGADSPQLSVVAAFKAVNTNSPWVDASKNPMKLAA